MPKLELVAGYRSNWCAIIFGSLHENMTQLKCFSNCNYATLPSSNLFMNITVLY